jgi:YbbR domain-containing protein
MNQLARLRPNRSVLFRILLSVILAVLLWGWVTSLADPSESRSATTVPVSNGVPGNGLVVSTTQVIASVRASGPRSVMSEIDRNGLALTLDLDGIDQPGTYTVPIIPVQTKRFVDYHVNPATASIVVDELVSRVFPIEMQTLPRDQTDRQVVGQQLSDPEVTISGPRSILDTIKRARVDVDVTGQTGQFSVRASVYAVTGDGNQIDSTTQQNVTINPSIVDATVTIQSTGREVTILADVTGTPATGYEQRITTTTPRTVVLDGPADTLAGLRFVETQPVDISGATATVTADVNIANLPEGVRLVSPVDGIVSVIVQIQQQSVDQTLPNLPVSVVGLDAGLSATASPTEVSIEISASSAQVPDLVNGAITVSVDAGGLAPGTYTLSPRVIVPAGVEWDTITPATVEVIIVASGTGTTLTPAATPGMT